MRGAILGVLGVLGYRVSTARNSYLRTILNNLYKSQETTTNSLNSLSDRDDVGLARIFAGRARRRAIAAPDTQNAY
jgi:hypothetical protein